MTASGITTGGPARQVGRILRLKAALVMGGFRSKGMDALGLMLGVVAAILGGAAGGFGILVAARTQPEAVRSPTIVVVALLPLFAMLFGMVVGSEGSIDPRKLALIPIDRFALGVGSLMSGLVGIFGVGATLLGIGVILGFAPLGLGAVVTVVATLSVGMLLLVVSRTTSNLLGLMTLGRFRHVAQVIVSLVGLILAAVSQGISWAVRQPTEWWDRTAASLRWLPSARLAAAITDSGPLSSRLLDLAVGLLTIAALVALHGWSFGRLLEMPSDGGGGRSRTNRRRAGREHAGVGTGRAERPSTGLSTGPSNGPRWRRWWSTPAGAVASRTLRLNVRNPRQVSGLIAAMALGVGPVIGVVAFGPKPIPEFSVFGGSLVQFVVLFNAINSFGMDGRALGLDLLSGRPKDLVRGKYVAAAIAGIPPAIFLPVALGTVSGAWRFVIPAMILALGAVLLGAGVAVVISLMAPVAVPDSPNPFASPESGQGCLSSIGLVLALLFMLLVTAPVAVTLVFIIDLLAWVLVLALVTFALCALLGELLVRTSTSWLTARVPETFAQVAPRD